MIITVLSASVFAMTACNNGDKEVVTVGYTVYPPMNYEDADGNLIGFDTELAKAVFTKLGYTVIFKEINWDNKYVDLNAGTISCIWNGFTSIGADEDNVQRNTKVDFSYNYMINAQCVVIRSSDSAALTDVASFSGKTGYVEAGSAGATYAADIFGEIATIRTATKQMDALMQVRTDAADFAVLDYQLANSVVGKGDYSNLTIVSSMSSDAENYAVGFKKGSALTAKVNSALEELAADGTILALAQKYGVAGSVITDYSDQKAA